MKTITKLAMCLFSIIVLQAFKSTNIPSSSTIDQNETNYLVCAINDNNITTDFKAKASVLLNHGKAALSNELKKQLFRKSCTLQLPQNTSNAIDTENYYTTFGKGVLIVGSLVNSEKFDGFQLSTASAFAITKNGICVSNYHVFKSYDPSKPKDYAGAFVMDYQGNVYPIVEILAASKADDLAVFRIECNKELYCLELGHQGATGTPVNLISHPNKRFYRYSSGKINRTYIRGGTNWLRQSISADFAIGSSGAPIMDNNGKVVGVVAGTQNIYADPESKALQMTIKEIIPVDRIKALIK